jgi:DNA-binding NarL/FixJ family response regulator
MRQLQLCPTILILTAYDYEEYIFPILDAGAAGYLLKDTSGDELIDSIRVVQRGESVLHPTVARKLVERFRETGDKHGRQKEQDLLTEREVEVLKLGARGMSNKDIGNELCLSIHTVESHFGSIFNKLGVCSRVEAVMEALRRGWFTLADISQQDGPSRG